MPDYVPNMLRCAKCNFELERFTMNANTGAVGIGTNAPDRCPNGCGPLWRVTWEQEARYLGQRMNEWAERAIAAEKKLAAIGPPVLVTSAPPVRAPCTVCGKPYMEHGTYPTCATHPYSADGRCGAVGTLERGQFIGVDCAGAQCVNGCARALGIPLPDPQPKAPSGTGGGEHGA